MKLTNLLNLPQPIVDAIANDPYSKGDADYSITGLLKSPRISRLEAAHWDELEEDVADRLYSLQGQVMHGILERAERVAFPEERLFATLGGTRISGQLDRLVLFQSPSLLQDYKYVTLRKFKDGVPEDFEAQVNCYHWLLVENGFDPVDKLEIVAIYRDWFKGQAMRDDRYPQKGCGVWPVDRWDEEVVRDYLLHRIRLHEDAKKALPLCSPEDRWADESKWAVMSPTRKNAVKLYDNAMAAQMHAETFGDKTWFIESRPGNPTKRCEGYCSVVPFCEQYKALKALK